MPGIYPIQYKAPDLSNIYKIARNTGRNQGLVEALEGQLDFRRDLYKMRMDAEAAAAKKRAAAAAASSDPENESFWDKLDQFGKDIVDKQERALSWGMEKIQRGLSGVAGAADEIFKADDENKTHGEKNFFEAMTSGITGVSPLELIDDVNVGTFKKAGKAAKKGFKGEEHTTWAEVIANQADDDNVDNIFDNKTYQAVAGFAGDVTFDPLSYVGAGLVTKPLKAGKAIKESNRLDDLARDIEKLGVKPGAEAVGLDKDVPLRFDEIKAMLGGVPKRGTTSTAQRAEHIRATSENLPRLKKWIREQPDLATDDTLKKLDDEIAKITKERDSLLDDAGKEAMARAYKDFDNNPKLHPEYPKASMAQEFSESLDYVKLMKAFEVGARASKGLPKSEREAVRFEKFVEEIGEGLTGDPRFTPEVIREIFETSEKLSKQSSRYRSLGDAIGAVSKRISSAKSYKGLTQSEEEAKNLKSLLTKEYANMGRYYDDRNLIRSTVFLRLMKNQLNKGTLPPESAARINELSTEGQAIIDRLKTVSPESQISDAPANMASDMQLSAKLEKGAAGEVTDEVRELRGRLDEISKEIKHLRGEDADSILKAKVKDTPVGISADNITEQFLKENLDDPKIGAWARVVNREFQARRTERFEALVQTFYRRKREERLEKLVPKYIRQAFGPGPGKSTRKGQIFEGKISDDYKHPFIKVGDETIYKTEKDKLAKFITDADKGKKQNPAHEAFDRLFKENNGKALSTMEKARRTNFRDLATESKVPADYNPSIPKSERTKMEAQASQDAIEDIRREIGEGGVKALREDPVDLIRSRGDLDLIHRANMATARDKYAEQVLQAKQTLKGRELEATLNGLRQERDLKLQLHKEAHEEAVKARKAMDERLDEQLLLDILEENITNQGNFLKINVAGFKIGEFRSPVAMMEKMGHMPVIKQANAAWSKAFRPASTIEPELNLARLRAQAATPQIIKHHVDDIRHRFSQFKPEERRAALKSLKSGVPVGNVHLYNAMEQYFDEMLPYLTGKVGISDEAGNIIDPLLLKDINQYLPPKYKFVDSKNVNTIQDALDAMTNLPHNEDAMRVLWHLRVGMEQALSQKAFKHTIKSVYGVARPDKATLRKLAKGEEVDEVIADRDKIIQSLGREHGWRTVGGLDDTHYFAPEVADDIEKLLDMMKPQNVNEVIQKYDKVIRAWKTTVTVYNPGYYVRNGIGEFMVGWFDGVTDPRWYTKASQVLRYAEPDAMEDTLRQLEPWKRHATLNQKASKPITRKKYHINGEFRRLNREDVYVLYNDVGLKSGFISSEFDHYVPAAGSLKATRLGQRATKINDGVRNKGEKYEDFFRIAHFLYRMDRSKLTDPLKAAEEASHFVRKFHFDYTDFTPFEKTAMLRLFPFYKWTRKAVPLMASMAFSNPGKAFAYPKAMNALSVGTGATDPQTDDNGWLPNYEEVTPKWMRDMFSYPMGTDQEGAMTYANVATPQMDVYKMMGDPVGTFAGMLTPGAKVPLEQMIGRPIDPEFKGMAMEGSQDRFDHLMRTTPITNLVNQSIKNEVDLTRESSLGEPGGPLDERLVSFLTGLGFYENSEARQQGELIRRREAAQ